MVKRGDGNQAASGHRSRYAAALCRPIFYIATLVRIPTGMS